MSKLWGGRFAGGLDPAFESFNRSLPFDHRLAQQDIQGSIAWAHALVDAQVLSATEGKKITAALKALAKELQKDPGPLHQSQAEDIHSFVESALGDKVGALAKKLHTGRSRNDQVATDLKLYMREAVQDLRNVLQQLMQALVQMAEQYADLPLPGFTHLQRAQPITAGHHALAYVEMLHRDDLRLQDAAKRSDNCPLGCAALAGTAFKVDRRTIAKELQFQGGATRNSLDSVSDRDHVCEVLFACSLIMTHLSRLAEDWIFFASQEAGYLSFGDAVATGSSLMPQKKNPDAMELLRGKAGRVAGHLQGMLMTLKGLPLAYNKDMQEDKEALFDGLDTTQACLRVAAVAVQNAQYNEERCRQQSSQGYLNATDLADLLVAAKVPFRDAHDRSGQVVRRALQLGVEIEDLPKAERKKLLPELPDNLHGLLSVDKVLARRQALGGTAPKRVRAEVRAWQKRLP